MTKRGNYLAGMIAVGMMAAPWCQATAEVEVQARAPMASQTTAAMPNENPTVPCQTNLGRKVLVAALPVQSPVQISDLPNFAQMVQAEITHRLDNAGFLAQRSGNEAAYALQSAQYAAQWEPDWIRDLARRHGAQFVVGGAVRDVGFEGERYTLSLGDDMRAGERKQEFGLPLLRFFKPGIKATPAARRFEFEVQVFDGISGSRISHHRFAGSTEGEVVLPRSVAMNSERFLSSDFGILVSSKIDAAVRAVDADVHCLPLMARVINIESDQVVLDAGSDSGLHIGARLQVQHLLPSAGLRVSADRDNAHSWPLETLGALRIKQVQPQFSVAEKEAAFAVEVGDYARVLVGQ